MASKLFLSSVILLVLLTFPLIGSIRASLELWSRTYGGTDSDAAYSLVELSDGGFAIAGYTESFGSGGYDFWPVKTDAQGIPEFPSWIIPPLFLIATLSAIHFRNKIRGFRKTTKRLTSKILHGPH